jgi:hypothetical protein
MTAKVPMSETGIATAGISVVLEKHEQDQEHERRCLEQRDEHLFDRLVDEDGGVVGHGVTHVFREQSTEPRHRGTNFRGDVEGIGPGKLINADTGRWRTAHP